MLIDIRLLAVFVFIVPIFTLTIKLVVPVNCPTV